jgi:hypothetical protein
MNKKEFCKELLKYFDRYLEEVSTIKKAMVAASMVSFMNENNKLEDCESVLQDKELNSIHTRAYEMEECNEFILPDEDVIKEREKLKKILKS